MLTCRYEIQAYFRSIYWSCSVANAVESRSFTIGLFMETKLFRLFWFYKISDVCYQPSTSTDTKTMENKAKLSKEVRNHITWYNGQQFDYTEGFIRNKKTFLIGMPRMRQLRIKKSKSPIFLGPVQTWNSSYTKHNTCLGQLHHVTSRALFYLEIL